MKISENIERLLNVVVSDEKPEYFSVGPDDAVIEVGRITSHAAHYYEKVRYSVDYKDEDLLQRSAIERIIKRKIAFGMSIEKIGEDLITELIQAGYLPNGELPQSLIVKVQSIINKGALFMQIAKDSDPTLKNVLFDSSVVGVIACEVEDMLFPSKIKGATADTFYNTIKDRVDVAGYEISQDKLDIQIYIASHRTLLKSDNTRLFYNLWNIYYPEWRSFNIKSSDDLKTMHEMAGEFCAIKEHFAFQLEHPVQFKLISKLKNDVIYFSVIMMILARNGARSKDIFSNYDLLVEEVRDFVSEKYVFEKERVNKMALRAILYIFLTKITLAFIVELPYDIFIEGKINSVALGINVIFHPMLLFLVTRNVAVGGDENLDRIIGGINNIIYGSDHKKIVLRVKKKKNVLFYAASLLYGVLFLFSFGAIIFILNMIGFNAVGMLMFILFLTLVSFFGLRIRYKAKTWLVHTHDERFLMFIWDLITLPIVSLGRWLTYKFSSINIFVFIMDFVIEMPFKAVLKVFDSFVLFVREKKEEIS